MILFFKFSVENIFLRFWVVGNRGYPEAKWKLRQNLKLKIFWIFFKSFFQVRVCPRRLHFPLLKSFHYCIEAYGITDATRKKNILLHPVGSGTQETFDTLADKGDRFGTALTALNNQFSVQSLHLVACLSSELRKKLLTKK